MSTSLIIPEPPLQVLPTLAQAIGLNDAIVLQQFHYLCRAGSGKVIDGESWVYDTYQELQRKFFPFWSEITIKRAILSLEERGWIDSCQPEGGISRRKYYRVASQAYLYLTAERYREQLETRLGPGDPSIGSKRYVRRIRMIHPSDQKDPFLIRRRLLLRFLRIPNLAPLARCGGERVVNPFLKSPRQLSRAR